jgi:Mg-chelatase subunit ChlI
MLNDDEQIMEYLQELVGKSRVRQRMPEEEAFQENYHDIAREIMSGDYEEENDEKRIQEEYQKQLAKYSNKSINPRDQQAAEEPPPRRERIVVDDEPYDDGFTDDALDMMQRLGLEDD